MPKIIDMPIKFSRLDVLLRNCQGRGYDYNEIMDILLDFNDFFLCYINSNDQFTPLEKPLYDDYWSSFLEEIPVDRAPQGFSFLAPNFMSNFQFIMGYLFYIYCSNHDDCRNNRPLYLKMLSSASNHHSYHALSALSHEYILILHKGFDSRSDDINNFINKLTNEALYHGTPGFILAANFYVHLSIASKMQAKELKASEKQDLLREADAYLLNALVSLDKAKFLESKSQNEINNAYFGKSLALSNPFNLASIDLMKEQCRKLHPIKLDSKILNSYKKLAEDDCEFKVKQHYELMKQYKAKAISGDLFRDYVLSLLQDEDDPAPKNANLEDKNQFGETAFLVATRLNLIPAMLKLIQYGANTRATDNQGHNALHLAILSKHEDAAAFLIRKQPSLINPETDYSKGMIGLATELGMQSIVELLQKSNYKQTFFSPQPSSSSEETKPLHKPPVF